MYDPVFTAVCFGDSLSRTWITFGFCDVLVYCCHPWALFFSPSALPCFFGSIRRFVLGPPSWHKAAGVDFLAPCICPLLAFSSAWYSHVSCRPSVVGPSTGHNIRQFVPPANTGQQPCRFGTRPGPCAHTCYHFIFISFLSFPFLPLSFFPVFALRKSSVSGVGIYHGYDPGIFSLPRCIRYSSFVHAAIPLRNHNNLVSIYDKQVPGMYQVWPRVIIH